MRNAFDGVLVAAEALLGGDRLRIAVMVNARCWPVP
jgi:hypothetical protein